MLYLVTVLVSFVGAMIQGVTGFGASLTIMTLLPYFVDLPSAVALSGVIPMVQMAVLVWLYRRAINLHRVIIPAFFYLIGCWISIRYTLDFDPRYLKFAFGIFFDYCRNLFSAFQRSGQGEGYHSGNVCV